MFILLEATLANFPIADSKRIEAELVRIPPLHFGNFVTARAAKSIISSKCVWPLLWTPGGIQNYNFIYGPNSGLYLSQTLG
jgi:hypothetical protein